MSVQTQVIRTEINRLKSLQNSFGGNVEVYKHFCGRSCDLEKVLDALEELDARLSAVEG